MNFLSWLWQQKKAIGAGIGALTLYILGREHGKKKVDFERLKREVAQSDALALKRRQDNDKARQILQNAAEKNAGTTSDSVLTELNELSNRNRK